MESDDNFTFWIKLAAGICGFFMIWIFGLYAYYKAITSYFERIDR